MEQLYDKNVNCPLCSTKFFTKQVRTKALRLIKQDKDFMPHYQGENPIKYIVFVCPNCGYAATEEKFDFVYGWEKEKILKEVSSKWRKRSYGGIRTLDEAIDTCKLALYVGQLLEESKLYLGSIALNTAWLYRLKEDKDEERRFLNIARKLYEEAYYKEDLLGSNMDEFKLAYLIGELNRRLGEVENAIKWFNIVVSKPNSNLNPTVRKLAVEQWRLAKEGWSNECKVL